MNERIKELANQAEAYAEAEYAKWTPDTDFSGVPNLREVYSNKLAELVIMQCLQAIRNEGKNPEHKFVGLSSKLAEYAIINRFYGFDHE